MDFAMYCTSCVAIGPSATHYDGTELLPSAEGLHNGDMLPIIRVALISGVGQVLRGHDIYGHAN